MKCYHTWRNYDLLCAILGNISFFFYMIYFEYKMNKFTAKKDIKKYPNPMDDPFHQDPYTNVIRLIVVILSGVALYCLY